MPLSTKALRRAPGMRHAAAFVASFPDTVLLGMMVSVTTMASAVTAKALQVRWPRFVGRLQRAPFLRHILPQAADAPFAVVYALTALLMCAAFAVLTAASTRSFGWVLAGLMLSAWGVLISVWVDSALAWADPERFAATERAPEPSKSRRVFLHALVGRVIAVGILVMSHVCPL